MPGFLLKLNVVPVGAVVRLAGEGAGGGAVGNGADAQRLQQPLVHGVAAVAQEDVRQLGEKRERERGEVSRVKRVRDLEMR